MATVIKEPDESFDSLLRRFRKSVNRSGVLTTLRKKRWYVSKGELARMKKRKGIQRARRRERRRESRTSRS